MDEYIQKKQALRNLHRDASEKKLRTGSSLCLHCAHIVPSPRRGVGCEWSVSGRPVPGWTAIECEFRINADNVQTSYCVKRCPKYIPYASIYRPDIH